MYHAVFKDESICHFYKAENPQFPVSVNSTPSGKTRDKAILILDSPSPVKTALSIIGKEGYKSLGAKVVESYRQLSIHKKREGIRT